MTIYTPSNQNVRSAVIIPMQHINDMSADHLLSAVRWLYHMKWSAESDNNIKHEVKHTIPVYAAIGNLLLNASNSAKSSAKLCFKGGTHHMLLPPPGRHRISLADDNITMLCYRMYAAVRMHSDVFSVIVELDANGDVWTTFVCPDDTRPPYKLLINVVNTTPYMAEVIERRIGPTNLVWNFTNEQ